VPVGARVSAQAGASLAERAVMAVRELIHDGQLLPGQPIRQVAIAEQLGMSRVPLREALQNLQAEGLVQPSATGGFVVTRLSSTELAQFYLMRRLLETELLRRVEQVPVAELDRLTELNARMAELVDTPSREIRTLNHEFHFRIFRLAGLHHVVTEVGRLWDRTTPYRTVYSTDRLARARIIDEHADLVEALRRGETDQLIEVMDAHRRTSELEVIQVLTRPAPPG
jgi:DNA-binding GntR family transcriptional regulator